MGLFKFEGRIYQKISNSYIIDVLILRILGKLFNRYWGLEGTRSVFKKRKN